MDGGYNMGSRILSVPYKSQNDADATFKRSDCGPCCIAMILAAMGQNVTTNQVTAASGIVGDSGLRLDQMVTTAAAFGLSLFFQSGLGLDDLKRFIDNGQPPIALINYGNIPDRFDQHYTGGHFVLVVGYDDDSGRVFINDPDYPPGSMGYQRPYSFPVFSGAWGGFEPNVNPNFCLVIPQPPKPIPGTATAAPQPVQPAAAGDVWVVAPAGLAFRAQADASAPLIGGLSFGQHLTALGAESGQDATGRTWQQVRTDAGVVGWVAASLSGDRLLSGTQPSAPYPVQVLDTQTMRVGWPCAGAVTSICLRSIAHRLASG
jgi:hypothetical protein